ncbi:MAG: SDR family oxidoreductase [Bacteroidota bacterium]
MDHTQGMLQGKNIVIIGGTSGIGLSAAQAFLEQGAHVVVTGLDEASCVRAEAEFQGRGWSLCLDARVEGTAQLAIEKCVAECGSFDGLFHVAGGSGRKWGDGPLHELSLKGWKKTLDLNLTSVMLSNQAAVQHFLAHQTPGSILNVSSVLGYSPAPRFFYTHAYTAAKAAIIGLSQSLASYYAAHNIRINVLAPALVLTEMSQRAQENEEIMHYIHSKQPLDGGRIGQPEDLNQLACYFLSDHARFTTGQVISVDGGWAVSEGQWKEK